MFTFVILRLIKAIMGRKCFVANCSSDSYTSEQISIFKSPSNNQELDKWIEHVPAKKRKLSSKDYVCELHFMPSCIIQNGPNGRKRLVKGAVPFVSAVKIELEEEPVTGHEEHIFVQNIEVPNGTEFSHTSNENLCLEDGHTEFTFDNIFSNPGLVTVPSDRWTVNVSSELNIIIWSKILTETNDNSLNPHVFYITLSKSLEYTIALDGKELLHKRKQKSPETLSELKNILLCADKLKFCTGGPRLSFYNHDNISCAERSDGKWKHVQCHILSDIGNTCQKCGTLFDIFTKHKIRRKKNVPVRIRVAPYLKTTTTMKKAMQKQSKTIARLQKQMEGIHTELDDTRKKLQHVSEASDVKELNVP